MSTAESIDAEVERVSLVHIQSRFRVMNYSGRYEASDLRTQALDRRTRTA
jgi:hypothetical protein